VLSLLEGNTNNTCAAPCVANGVLFTVQGKWLCAVCDKGEKSP